MLYNWSKTLVFIICRNYWLQLYMSKFYQSVTLNFWILYKLTSLFPTLNNKILLSYMSQTLWRICRSLPRWFASSRRSCREFPPSSSTGICPSRREPARCSDRTLAPSRCLGTPRCCTGWSRSRMGVGWWDGGEMWSWSCLADQVLSLVLEGYKTTIHVCVTSHFVRELEDIS